MSISGMVISPLMGNRFIWAYKPLLWGWWPSPIIWVFPKNRGTPKSSILIGFSTINHPVSGTPIFGNTHMEILGVDRPDRTNMSVVCTHPCCVPHPTRHPTSFTSFERTENRWPNKNSRLESWKSKVFPTIFYHGPPKPTFLEVFMVNNLVFRWPKPLFFHGLLGAHGSWWLNQAIWKICSSNWIMKPQGSGWK